jgi:hypothetical protein
MADEAASQPTSQALASSSLVIAAIDPTATVDDQLKCARVIKDIEVTIYTLVLLSPQTVTNVNIALNREMYPRSGDAVILAWTAGAWEDSGFSWEVRRG